MTALTILYIVIAGIIAPFLALFLYKKKDKGHRRLNALFIFLRFITLFAVLLLIINPKFEKVTFYLEKPNLILAVDNSSSIRYSNQDKKVLELVKSLKTNKQLNSKFNIELYTFGNTLKASNSLLFTEQDTNIDLVFNQLSQVFKNDMAPMVLITDGNQTYGNDYLYTSSQYKQPIYPIILGDTITYTDLSIQQLNVNKYAFLKNDFPVECIVVYNGNHSVTSRFEVSSDKTILYSSTLHLSKSNNSKVINFTLPAKKVGVTTYKATIVPIDNEKNIINNSKSFAVEVIDQKTNVAIVSDFPHPDIGSLKKSIENNEQRSVSILSPTNYLSQKNDFQLVILYQPNNKFKSVIESLHSNNISKFIIIGTDTDLNFLNAVNPFFTQEITNQREDIQALINTSYSPFILDDVNFESFPPLKSNFGMISFSVPYETLLYKRIGSNTTTIPLLATYKTRGRREAVLFGEDIWKWRSQSFLNTKSFTDFDDFIGKIIQYLAISKPKSRLNLEYESFYNGANGIIIKAEFFDKNYNFDNREALTIKVKDASTNKEQTFPFILKNNRYQVDLSRLPPSEYTFTVSATNEKISQIGAFKILEYNVEQQFLNANINKLQQVAARSSGNSYFIEHTDSLINDLINENTFITIQKENKNTISLIDWKYLLFLIVLSLTMEWFLRKYNGLI
tara:strand:- start:6371 stop:8404 length:2034 start_codon:yes stop_codon:yes gene_type:complete